MRKTMIWINDMIIELKFPTGFQMVNLDSEAAVRMQWENNTGIIEGVKYQKPLQVSRETLNYLCKHQEQHSNQPTSDWKI